MCKIHFVLYTQYIENTGYTRRSTATVMLHTLYNAMFLLQLLLLTVQ